MRKPKPVRVKMMKMTVLKTSWGQASHAKMTKESSTK